MAALSGNPMQTGWIDITDTEYSEGSPLALAAATPTILTNNAGFVRDLEAPRDLGPSPLTAMYDALNNKILGACWRWNDDLC
jgi:hypothetical protein